MAEIWVWPAGALKWSFFTKIFVGDIMINKTKLKKRTNIVWVAPRESIVWVAPRWII